MTNGKKRLTTRGKDSEKKINEEFCATRERASEREREKTVWVIKIKAIEE